MNNQNAETKEDKVGVTFKGGALNMESTKAIYLQNKNSIEMMFANQKARKTQLFEESGLLSEDNIIDNLD